MTFEQYLKNNWVITQPKTTHPEKLWYAQPIGHELYDEATLSAGDLDTLKWMLQLNYKEWIRRFDSTKKIF